MQLQDVLRALRPRIPESLLAGAGWDRLLQRVGDLPAEAARQCGFELKLDDPAPAADFSVVVTPGAVGRHFRARSSDPAAASTETWLGDYLAGRSEPLDWLLLAYDIVDVADGRQVSPAVYFRSGAALPSGGPAFEPDRLADTLGQIAGAGANDGFERRALTRAFKALPHRAAVVFAAAAPDRAPGSVRLVVAEIPESQLGPFLEKLEWPGSISVVSQLLSRMRDVSDRYMLAFDMTASGALPRLGLEMYPKIPFVADYSALLLSWLKTTGADWSRLAGHLVDMSLCLPAKADGLLSWPGQARLFGDDGIYLLHMGINHIKLVIDGERLRAKAYAGLKYYPLTLEAVNAD